MNRLSPAPNIRKGCWAEMRKKVNKDVPGVDWRLPGGQFHQLLTLEQVDDNRHRYMYFLIFQFFKKPKCLPFEVDTCLMNGLPRDGVTHQPLEKVLPADFWWMGRGGGLLFQLNVPADKKSVRVEQIKHPYICKNLEIAFHLLPTFPY